MLDIDEIKLRLKDVDPQLCVIFAARCSLRILPFLVLDEQKEDFWYWDKKKRPQYLLALLTAQQISINFSSFGRKINIATTAKAFRTAKTAYRDTANARTSCSADAANAVYLAASTAYITTNPTSYVIYAANAAKNNFDLETEMRSDLNFIDPPALWKKTTSHIPPISASEFTQKPLWATTSPKKWQLHQFRFTAALIALDPSFDIWADWYNNRINGVLLNFDQEQQWLDIPTEIREQGAKVTNIYLATLSSSEQKNTLKPLNLVRAIFIGNGAAGKTSLIRKLNNEPVVEGKEEMTPGIEIREWSIPDSEIKARFWDFGGQVMSHSTHQFFLRERCLYILVLDARTEVNANDQAEYWLEHVKAFGNKAPVMLVGNKSDLTAVNLNMNALRDKYHNIIGFYEISCTNNEARFKRRFDLFTSELAEQLQQVGTGQIMFTANQFTVLEQVRQLSRQNAFLAHQHFNRLCKENDIGKEGLDQHAFLGLLDSLGEIIHFPDLEWSDAYVLNPRWLTYGVYALLYSEKANKQQGVLSHADVIAILHPKVVKDEQDNELSYPKEKCRFIIDAMSKFKLCYHLSEDSRRFVIPDKLSTEQPVLAPYFDKNIAGTLDIEFDFQGLLPRNIMPNLIVARHKEIVKDNNNKQLVWQHGVIIHHTDYQASARLQVDYHQRTLQLWLQGKEKREYLVLLRDEIYTILNAIKGLSVKENVILPALARINDDFFRLNNEAMEKITYKSLIEQAKANRKTVFSDAGNQYDLAKVIGFIMTKKQQKEVGVANANNNIEIIGDGNKINIGDGNKIDIEQLTLNATDQPIVNEFQHMLATLMTSIENHQADFKIKMHAYNELEAINRHLADLKQASPETKTKLQQLLTSIKDGSLSAFKLANEIKDSNETVAWLIEKAPVVSALLAANF